MTARPLLHGLTDEESVLAIQKLLFGPPLQKHFGSDWCHEWTCALVANFTSGKDAAFSSQYNSLVPEVKSVFSGYPKYSIANPPWSMVSLEMQIGLIPWITPIFDQGFQILLAEGSALEKHFGIVLPFAFFLSGGPGDSMDNAFRICAPSQAVRTCSEHWLMRAYLSKREDLSHATLSLDNSNRTFSAHRYIDIEGVRKQVYFETTDSFSREEADFQDFLHGEI